jgi:hypothetical protein
LPRKEGVNLLRKRGGQFAPVRGGQYARNFHYINNTKDFGEFYKVIRIKVEGYIISYASFEDYKNYFICNSSDLKGQNLVGLKDNEIYANLLKIDYSQIANRYSVFIPIRIK